MYRGATDSFMKIVRPDRLLFHLDAAQLRSYGGSGTTWTDLTNKGKNGTLINGPTFSSLYGGAFSFDGVDDYVSLGTASSSLAGPSDFTYIIWHRLVYFLGDQTIVCVNKTDGNAWIGPRVYWGSGGGQLLVRFFLWTDNGQQGYVENPVNQSFETNYHIATSYNSASREMKIYKNGVLEATGLHPTGGNIWYINPDDFRIGWPIQSGTSAFSGKLFSFRSYNLTLTAAEILADFNATKTRFGY